MLAVLINAVLVAAGSIVGLLFTKHINERYTRAIMCGLALCVALIGIGGALETENMLCVVICVAVGTLLGELLGIEAGIERFGEKLKRRVVKSGKESRFTEGFLTATLVFCVGSMAIVGSMEAGIKHDYTTIISKSVIDCITAAIFASAMGVGVAFSAFGILVYQGLITLLAIWIGPFLPAEVITEMTAVGGLLILAISVNMLGLLEGERKLRVGNMLPAIFLPIAYIPLADFITGLF